MGPLASLPGQAPMARWALALALALAPTPHHHTQPPARQAHPAIGCTWGGKPPSVGLFIDDSLTNPLGGLRGVARWHGGFAPRRGVAPLAGASGWGGFGWVPSACVKPHATSGATARPRAGTAANSKETLAPNRGMELCPFLSRHAGRLAPKPKLGNGKHMGGCLVHVRGRMPLRAPPRGLEPAPPPIPKKHWHQTEAWNCARF